MCRGAIEQKGQSLVRVATIALVSFGLLGAHQAIAGSCRDAWVTQAVQQVTGHAPNGSYESGDCNIHNYGDGHWSSYSDLVNKVHAHFGRATVATGVCRDQWVTRAVTQVMGRAPNGSYESGECNIHNYGGGHWSSYSDLVNKVKVAFGRVPASNAAAANGSRGPMNIAPNIGFNGSGVIAAGGGNVIAPGGGNVIAPGGGNVIAPGGGNVIAPGGGN